MENIGSYKIINQYLDIPNNGNTIREMTDEQLRQLFNKDDIATNEDHIAIIDSKLNKKDTYTREQLEQILEAYFHHDPATASVWIANEQTRQANEVVRINHETERENNYTGLKNQVTEKINNLNAITNQITTNETTRVSNETERQRVEELRISNENTRIANENQRVKSVSDMQQLVNRKIAEVEQSETDMMKIVTTTLTGYDIKIENLETTNPIVEVVQSRVGLGQITYDTLNQRLNTDFDKKVDKTSVYTKEETNNLIKNKTEINDSIVNTTTAWSGSKVSTELNAKSSVGHKHSMGDVTGLVLSASNVTVADTDNLFEATTVEGVLKEIYTKVNGNRVQIISNLNAMIDMI